MRTRAACWIVLVAVAGSLDAAEEDHGAGLPVSFAGTVHAGERFEHRINDTYLFVLSPQRRAENPPGWTIRVVDADEPERDYLWVVTPPYRFKNPRYLDTGYGLTAQEAVTWTPRTFGVLRRPADYGAVVAAIRTALWPEPETDGVELAASLVKEAVADARRGELRITGALISRERIERLSFEVVIE